MRPALDCVAVATHVLFDLDGTLVDTTRALARSVATLASSAGLEPISADVVVRVREEAGASRPALAAALREQWRSLDTPTVTKLVSDAYDAIPNHLEPDERVLATLRALAAERPLAIVTNGSTRLQRAKWSAAGLADVIPAARVVVSGEVGERKPARAIFERALITIGAPPATTLFVGDEEIADIGGARAAGMITCRVAPEGTETAAHARIAHVGELWEDVCAT